MPAEGICLRVTHTGAVNTPLLVTDIHDGKDPNGRVAADKPGAVYIPVSGFVDLVYTSQVAESFEQGTIRTWIDIGYLTAAFVLGTTFESAISIAGSIQTEDEGVLVESETKTLNFIGGNIAATAAGGNKVDVTVIGAGGAIIVEDEGVVVDAATTAIDFVGSEITASSTGPGQVQVQVTSTTYWNVVTTAVNRNAADTEFILIDAATVTITLPAPVLNARIACKVVSPVITDIQIQTNAPGVLIDGTDYSVVGLPLTTQFEMINLISDGNDWYIF
jgi:hypothetical protein